MAESVTQHPTIKRRGRHPLGYFPFLGLNVSFCFFFAIFALTTTTLLWCYAPPTHCFSFVFFDCIAQWKRATDASILCVLK
jgi:hypothetical protein